MKTINSVIHLYPIHCGLPPSTTMWTNFQQLNEIRDSGIVNDLRRDSKYQYKLASRQALRQEELQLEDEISQLYLKKDVNKFWMK